MYDFELRERTDEDLAAAEYDRLYHGFPVLEYWDDDFASFVARYWHAGDRVLDLGCATASLWEQWARLPHASRLVGVDISEQMIERARRKHPEGEFHVARAHDLPFENGSFDIVVVSSVLHHIPDSHLAGALGEIARVLDEHGRLVGRDPIRNSFAAEPGWFSGSVMSFRHFVYRLTRSREYPEPELGEHHHVLDVEAFRELLSAYAVPLALERRFAFSSFVSRVRDSRIMSVARRLDELTASRGGTMLYYAAEKNHVSADDLLRVVRLARDEADAVSDAEFLAYLQAATLEIARAFGEDVQDGGAESSS
jgi:SAM-dependent methyltransferase